MTRVVHYAPAEVEGGLIRHVTLLAPRTPARGAASEAWLSPSPAIDAAAGALAAAGVPVRRLAVRGKGDWRGALEFRRALRESAPDLLHVHLASPVESIPVLLLARAERARIVTTEHAPTHHPRRRPWSGAAKRLASGGVARVIVLCEPDAAYLEEAFGLARRSMRLIPNGVPPPGPVARDEARRALGIPGGEAVVACVGEIAERKGIGDLLDAAAILARDGRLPLVLLAGEGAFDAQARERAGALGLGGRVRFLGRVDPPDAVYAACDLLVLPSRGEALPFVLLEAMAAGAAIVATRVGGIPAAIRDGDEGRLVDAGEPAALAAAMGALLAAPEERERLGVAARRRALSEFGADAMAAATCALYAEVLGEGRR